MAGLLTQVARRSYKALGKQLAGAAEGLEGNAALRALTAVYVRFARDNTGRFRLMGRTDLIELEDDDLRAAAYRAMRPLAAAAAGTRGLGVPTPEFERLDPRLIAAIAPAHGLAHLATEGRLAATMRSGEVDAQAQDALVDEVRLMETMQPASNHNGGHVAFGPDGWLYYGLGDGGGADDTYQNGQNKMTVLGTVLRLDVSGPSVRAAPGNPFEDDPTGDDRIWAYGLRNPWRFSFDEDGNLWIADVGQDAWEEVNRQTAGSRGGQNYGWPAYEGTHRNRGLDAPGHVPPIAEYERNRPQCSITGGYVGQDPGVPELMDRYVFGDYCSGRIWTLHEERGDWVIQELMDTDMLISSFGEDVQGRLYVVDLNGAVHRFV